MGSKFNEKVKKLPKQAGGISRFMKSYQNSRDIVLLPCGLPLNKTFLGGIFFFQTKNF
jgi:hypothetical protein